jgi:hypothetical protein
MYRFQMDQTLKQKKEKTNSKKRGFGKQRSICHQTKKKYVRPRGLKMAIANIYTDTVLC